MDEIEILTDAQTAAFRRDGFAFAAGFYDRAEMAAISAWIEEVAAWPEAPAAARKLIKRADRAAAYLEATQLAGFAEDEAGRFFGRPRGLERLRLKTLPPDKAKARYLRRFAALADRGALKTR